MVQYAPAPISRERKPMPTLEEIQTSRKIAEAMMREGSSYEPVGHWTQGAARVAQALVGSMRDRQANDQTQSMQGDANDALMGLYQPPSVTGGMPPVPASAMQPEPAMSQEEASIGKFANPNVAPSPVAQAMAGGNAPASVRYNNPGAQYPGQSAKRFGTTGTEIIGGGHQIAKFASPVQGAAAQFDLLSRSYAGMPLAAAITKWSGGNSSPQYVAAISKATGLSPNTVLTPQMLQDPQVAVPLAKTMAQWEAGRPYPMDDNQWSEAHRMALGGPQQTAQPQPQQMPMQMADASQGQGMTRETLQRLLANPMTRDAAQKMILKQADPSTARSDLPNDAQEYEYFKRLSPQEQDLYLKRKRSQPGVGVAGDLMYQKDTGETVRNIGDNLFGAELAKGRGDTQAKGEAGFSKAVAAYDMANLQDQFVVDDIKKAMSAAGPWTTGFTGNVASYVKGTPSSDLGYMLEGIKANLAFDKLQAIRDASPTGGALGAVSERELSLLESAWGSVAQAQSEAQFKERLGRLITIKTEYAAKRKQAYAMDVAKFGKGAVPNVDGGQPATDNPYKSKYGLD